MTDTFSRKRRSEIMRRICSTDTRAELTVRSMLHGAGFRFRLHSKDLPGKPDIVLPRYRIVVLVNGCLWHGHHNCRRGRRPKSNTDYWNRKIERNRERDRANARLLRERGWKRIVVWECELKDPGALRHRLISGLTDGKFSQRR